MDRLFEITDMLPSPPGQGPFHVRGLFYDHVLKHATTSPGGVQGLLTHIPDDRVRMFMRQRFSWGNWYDAMPMVPVQAALCRLQDGEFEELVRKRSRAAAETLVPRMFRVVLGLGNPKAAAEHLPRLLAYYFDFAELSIEVEGNQGHGILSNVPSLLAPSYVNTVIGLVDGALRLMGAKLIEADYSDVSHGQRLHGFETVGCKVNFHWAK